MAKAFDHGAGAQIEVSWTRGREILVAQLSSAEASDQGCLGRPWPSPIGITELHFKALGQACRHRLSWPPLAGAAIGSGSGSTLVRILRPEGTTAVGGRCRPLGVND